MKAQFKKDGSVKNNSLVIQQFPGYFLLLCLVFSLVALYILFKPFLVVLLFAAILATTFHSFYHRILKLFRGHQRLAAFFTCMAILILVVIPVLVFLLILGKQAVNMYTFILQKIQGGDFDSFLHWQKGNVFYDFFMTIQNQYGNLIDLQKIDLKASILDFSKNLSAFLFEQTAVFLKGLGNMLFDFILLFFALYYFLKDGHLITQKLEHISPLPARHDLELFRTFKSISKATLYGVFLTSIAQGILGGIGFMIVGIPNSLFWGTAIAFFSLIPLVGTAIVWLPAVIILFASGNVTGAIILLLWSLLLVSTVDNFLRAFLIGNQVKLNPLLAFLSIFGGIGLFGLVGVVFGPLILTLFFTFVHIYQLEYKLILQKPTSLRL